MLARMRDLTHLSLSAKAQCTCLCAFLRLGCNTLLALQIELGDCQAADSPIEGAHVHAGAWSCHNVHCARIGTFSVSAALNAVTLAS